MTAIKRNALSAEAQSASRHRDLVVKAYMVLAEESQRTKNAPIDASTILRHYGCSPEISQCAIEIYNEIEQQRPQEPANP